MVADCSACCARWVLCLTNFSLIIVSTGVLLIGTWLAADKDSFINITLNITTGSYSPASDFIDNDAKKVLKEFVEPAVIEQAAYILLAVGALIFILSFLGYCGAIKESRILLTTYGIFLVLIFALQVALILLITLYKQQADQHSQEFLKSTLSEHYVTGPGKDGVSLAWDLVMAHLGCCGLEDYKDFSSAKLFQQFAGTEGLGRQVPESCCVLTGSPFLLKPKDPLCVSSPDSSNSYMSIGCHLKFQDMITTNLDMVIGVVVTLAAAQLLAIVLSFCLCKAIGRERDYRYKY